ncbi:ead/Ea22-like family protein [Pseudomonas parakoreensis]|uniref:ead/Ea22-like family protein n=1 Tax=Pseudomonas parakoreensis TaxID=2892331 RepID=UPI001F3AB435|nr:ead/Ea22-like family protein [Pseudomonas parakoreensis]
MSKPNAAQKLAADLAALAKAATPGPWATDGDHVNEHGYVLYSYVASGRRSGGRIAGAFANCLVKTDEQCRANAAFIAGANPKAVLMLTNEIERLQNKVNTLIAAEPAAGGPQ